MSKKRRVAQGGSALFVGQRVRRLGVALWPTSTQGRVTQGELLDKGGSVHVLGSIRCLSTDST